MAFAQDIRAIESSIAHRTAAALRGLFNTLNARRLERRTYRELNALGDRELEDLGLSRSALHAVAREASRAR